MAKYKGLFKVRGSIDDLNFYKSEDGYRIRSKGGVSGDRIKNDPAFERTRENNNEFGICATGGKMLRRAAIELMANAKDSKVSSRLTQTMFRVKDADITSFRGDRQIAIGLETIEGRDGLKGFEFNNKATLAEVLQKDFTLDPATGEIEILDFNPMLNLLKPEGATHVSLTSGFLKLDFATGTKDMQTSPVFNTPINATAQTVILTPPSPASGSGNDLYFLKIAFFQQVNSIQYPLKNGTFNALQLVEVL